MVVNIVKVVIVQLLERVERFLGLCNASCSVIELFFNVIVKKCDPNCSDLFDIVCTVFGCFLVR